MKKLIFGALFCFLLLCLIALYQSGQSVWDFKDTGLLSTNRALVNGASATRGKLNTNLVDQLAVPVLSQQSSEAERARSESAAERQSLSSFLFTDAGVLARGRVVPQAQALLSASMDGTVGALYISEGDVVAAGQILLVLNDQEQRATVAEAQAELNRARAELEKIKAPFRMEEVEAAQAALDAVKAKLRRLEDSTLPGQLAIAEAGLAAAIAEKEQVLAGPREAEVLAARAELDGAELFLKEAQRAYDQVSWRNDVGLLPESANLQEATVRHSAALARYRAVFSGATEHEITEANAIVEKYQAELKMLQLSMPSDREALEAEVRFYQSRLALLLAEPLQADLNAAAAKFESARARLDKAEAALHNTVLRAPFAGTVAMINLNVGERVQTGRPLIRVADLSSWQIETEDMTELDLMYIEVGSEAEIRFDAIPDLLLTGSVKNIRPYGEGDEKDIYFTAIILPEVMDERLNWNMSAYLTFDAPDRHP